MKDDPFARLGGLDQQLFAQHSAETAAVHAGPTKNKPGMAGNGRSNVPEDVPTSARTKERRSQRSFEPSRPRRTERHPYDFYVDQILWLNHMKVQLQETYGCRITANAMVQLALELFIQDYRKRGSHSHLVSELALKQRTEETPEAATEEADEGTDGRPEDRPQEGQTWKR